jgi:cyclopropane-fatty-acyl-phospholipid synthase
MSHETIGPERAVLYTMPSLPSDLLRSMQFDQFFDSYRGRSFCVRTGDGWRWSSIAYHAPACTVTFRTREMLDGVINDAAESTVARLFLDGELDIQGDMPALLSVAEYVLRHSGQLSRTLVHTLSRVTLELSRRVKTAGRTRIFESRSVLTSSLTSSCSLPLDFFEQWLGPSLAHFCARFHGPEENLDAAQRNSLESVCRLLRLEREDRLLEVGCGWGSLLLHAAGQYRADARGTTSSAVQAEAINRRIRERDMQRRCAAEVRNLRTAPYAAETFDKVVEIGIFEQVESRDPREYFCRMHRMLAPEGLLLVHRMTRPPEHKAAALHSDLFLNSELAPLSKEIEAAEAAGLEVRSVENLREDYEHTLRVWIQRLQQTGHHSPEAASNRGYRFWLLYLIDLATAVQAGDLQIQQVLLRRAAGTSREWPPENSAAC